MSKNKMLIFIEDANSTLITENPVTITLYLSLYPIIEEQDVLRNKLEINTKYNLVILNNDGSVKDQQEPWISTLLYDNRNKFYYFDPDKVKELLGI